jgi:hypothetical protein
MYYGYKWTQKCQTLTVDEMDFFSGSRVEEEEEEAAPVGFVQKAWAAIM